MYTYNNFSRIGLAFCLITSVSILSGCDNTVSTAVKPNNQVSDLKTNTNEIRKNNSIISSNIIDWSSNRIRNKVDAFSIKSAADNLKINHSVNDSALDRDKTINSPNSVLTGRVSTFTDPTNLNLLLGVNTDFNSELRVGDKLQLLTTNEIVQIASIAPKTKSIKIDSPVAYTKTIGSTFKIISTNASSTSNQIITGRTTTTLDPTSKTLEFTISPDNAVIDSSSKIVFDTTNEEIALSEVKEAKQKIQTVNPITKTTTESAFKVYISGSDRGKSFGAMSLNPAINLNGSGTGDDVLYYTSDNTTGSNLFALNSSGGIVWEQSLGGNFKNSSPSFSKGANPKTYLGKNVMYLASKDGNIYCVNTDGKLVSSIKISDSFKNSVFVDANDANADYVYAASVNGNFYRLKLDFSNSQSQVFTSDYSVKLGDTSFSSSPVLNNSSVYVGGENGTFYQIIPNTGDVSTSWDLTLYNKNSAAKIVGTPLFDNITNSIIIPAGGYLFRIVGSTVTQSPLLELRNGINSRNQPYGSVLNTDSYATGNIISSPVISNNGSNLIYIANGNALFESNISSVDTFKNSANYCLGISGRLDDSDTNLSPAGNGVVALSTSGSGVRAAMVDTNLVDNISPYINYFTLPLNSATDNLLKYMPVNEFDSTGHSLKGINSSSIADNSGNVYFTLDNGAVKILATP